MNTIEKLVAKIGYERQRYLDQIQTLDNSKAQWKPKEEEWNIVEITEHLFWAEQGGILGMWKTILAIRDGKMERKFDSIHKDLPIEQIIERTWKEKEIVPPVAAPRLGGPLTFWIASLYDLQDILKTFGQELQDEELRLQAHPHPISGPLDFQQRLEFLSFHLIRHRNQVSRLLMEMN